VHNFPVLNSGFLPPLKGGVIRTEQNTLDGGTRPHVSGAAISSNVGDYARHGHAIDFDYSHRLGSLGQELQNGTEAINICRLNSP
jgi:hypothetical protein